MTNPQGVPRAYSLPHSYPVDDEFVEKAMTIAEALANLTYLICLDSDDPGLVRSYATQAGERLGALGELLGAIPPEN